MKIIIDYDSAWRNSFLDGNNNEPLPKNGRKFVGSMTSLKKSENFIKREITNNTVMGLLNRIIGDQRKLYQARGCDKYYFKDMDFINSEVITFQDKVIEETNEMTYIRNITGSTDQASFTGAIKYSHPIFCSDYSLKFWGVLALDLDLLYTFILNNTKVDASIELDPLILADKCDKIEKIKGVENTKNVSEVVVKLSDLFPNSKNESPYIEKNGKIKPMRLYAAALYIQYERLKKDFDMTSAISERGLISGFSKRGFNGRRDFMKAFTTGKPKIIWGNPYIHEEFIKGEGKTKHLMTKASGQLEINIDVSRERAREIKAMIENAGVSSFYLGKKGLAYISSISTREMKK